VLLTADAEAGDFFTIRVGKFFDTGVEGGFYSANPFDGVLLGVSLGETFDMMAFVCLVSMSMPRKYIICWVRCLGGVGI